MFNQSWKLSNYCFETEQMAAIAASRSTSQSVTFPTPQGMKARMRVDVTEYLYELKKIIENTKPSSQYPSKGKIQYIITPTSLFKPDSDISRYIDIEVRKSGWIFSWHHDQKDGTWYTLEEL